MIKKIPNNSWKNYSGILDDYIQEKNEKWGLRFYLLLSECLTKWAFLYKNSNFEKIYLNLKNNSLFYKESIYYNSDFDDLNICDEKFFNLFNLNKEIIEKSVDLKNKDNFEILEKIEEIKKCRKIFLLNIFTEKIEEKKLKRCKNEYENKILKNYSQIENFLENPKNNEKLKGEIIKELELANNQLELYDNIFINCEFNNKSIQNLRSGICNILLKIYGGFPEQYSNFLENGKIEISQKSFNNYKKNSEKIFKNNEREKKIKNPNLKKKTENNFKKKHENIKIENLNNNKILKKPKESPKLIKKREIDNITSINKNYTKSRSRFSKYVRNNESVSISDINDNSLINKFNYEYSQMQKKKKLERKKDFIKKKENFEKKKFEIEKIDKNQEENNRNKFIRNKLLIEEFEKKEEKYQFLKKKYRNLCNKYKNKCLLDCYFTMESDKYTKKNY